MHGDTSTTFAAALASFYLQIPVGHVEGLGTHNIYSPYPEEFNRQAVSVISKFNFAPTENLAKILWLRVEIAHTFILLAIQLLMH